MPEKTISIRGETINLGQLVKLLGMVDTGGEVRQYLDSSVVMVNGEIEKRRGRKLFNGDTLIFPDAQTIHIKGSSSR